MLEPKRIESNVLPQKFVNLGNGSWYYNYDIKSKVVEVPRMGDEGETATETRWSYIQIKLSGKPEYKKCVETIIRKYITQSQEFDLINSANRVLLNVGTERLVPSKYLEYLDLVDEIKANVRADFEM